MRIKFFIEKFQTQSETCQSKKFFIFGAWKNGTSWYGNHNSWCSKLSLYQVFILIENNSNWIAFTKEICFTWSKSTTTLSQFCLIFQISYERTWNCPRYEIKLSIILILLNRKTFNWKSSAFYHENSLPPKNSSSCHGKSNCLLWYYSQ